MKFEDSSYFHSLTHNKVEFSFGNFFLFDNFIISEIDEGIHFDWDKIQEVVGMLYDNFGKELRIGYISNRINSYSIDPQNWVDFQEQHGFIVASAIISYSEFAYMNATIEKRFSENSLKRCINLDDAISWIQNLKEFN